MSKSLVVALERTAALAESMMDSVRLSDEQNPCPICSLRAIDDRDHDRDCAYRIARTEISPADIAEIRRLTRVLSYDGTKA